MHVEEADKESGTWRDSTKRDSDGCTQKSNGGRSAHSSSRSRV